MTQLVEESRLVSRERFVAELRDACNRRVGYASGKLGVVERDWLYYPLFIAVPDQPV